MSNQNLRFLALFKGIFPLSHINLEKVSYQSKSYTCKNDHGRCTGLDHIKCHLKVIPVGDEHHIHMKNFHYGSHEESVGCRGLFSFKDKYAHEGCNKARESG